MAKGLGDIQSPKHRWAVRCRYSRNIHWLDSQHNGRGEARRTPSLASPNASVCFMFSLPLTCFSLTSVFRTCVSVTFRCVALLPHFIKPSKIVSILFRLYYITLLYIFIIAYSYFLFFHNYIYFSFQLMIIFYYNYHLFIFLL